ncbi:MAG TPA: hypothetical protein VFU31_30525 [Candidatus Binatia bacterium]|nr:hypothetical protein [Candidatus Binatia bacterium]
MKTTVIHHSADFDGIFCREIARKFLPSDTEFIGWDFKDKPLPIPDGKIYVMDLPLDRVFGFTFPIGPAPIDAVRQAFGTPGTELLFERVIWIDHHRTSIDTHPPTINGYRIDGVAACRLAWQWFQIPSGKFDGDIRANIAGTEVVNFSLPTKQDFIDRTVIEPLAVRLAGEYDIWDKRDPRAELFQHGLKSEELTPRTWATLLGDEFIKGEICVDRLLKQGEVLQFARANEYRDVITQQGFDVQFEGLTFLACNSHELDIRSQLFEAGIQPHHDALMGFTFNGKAKDWRVSLYHAPGKEHHDLSEIAKRYGGGGHRGACGFRLKGWTPLPSFVSP